MWPNIYYAAPLVVVISLVYGATRHEQPSEIIKHSNSLDHLGRWVHGRHHGDYLARQFHELTALQVGRKRHHPFSRRR